MRICRGSSEFIALSVEREKKARSRARRVQALVYLLLIGMIAGLFGWINQSSIKEQINWYWTVRPFAAANIWPYVLTGAAERALIPKQPFRECATAAGTDYCPEMVVIPAGSFTMGSPPAEKGRYTDEGPQHQVTIASPFAVSKFELTFDEWDTCVAYGDCADDISDDSFGRRQRPVINETWDQAKRYVAWLSRMTGKPYRLLTEAEYEYAARAGTQTAYPWGHKISKGNANCDSCGSQWDGRRKSAPVGSSPPNPFDIYDMVGNVWQWLEDCFHPTYDNGPTDGLAWTAGCPDDRQRVGRGASWDANPSLLRSATRSRGNAGIRSNVVGFSALRGRLTASTAPAFGAAEAGNLSMACTRRRLRCRGDGPWDAPTRPSTHLRCMGHPPRLFCGGPPPALLDRHAACRRRAAGLCRLQIHWIGCDVLRACHAMHCVTGWPTCPGRFGMTRPERHTGPSLLPWAAILHPRDCRFLPRQTVPPPP